MRFDYYPRGAAYSLFQTYDPEVLLEGPAGTGKTRAALEKLNQLAHVYPGMRGLIMRQTRASLNETALQVFEDWVLPEGDPCLFTITSDGRRTKPDRRNRAAYQYPNGSRIVVGGMDNEDRIMSGEYDAVLVCEAHELRESSWEKLLSRLRRGTMKRANGQSWHQAIADVNPQGPRHWLNLRALGGGMVRMKSAHEDNPILHTGEDWTEAGANYLKILDRLTGVRRERLRFGRWVAAEGAIYGDCWQPAEAIVNPFEVPADWPKYRVVDFGYNNPAVCQWWAVDPDGTMFRYRLLYETGLLTVAADPSVRTLATILEDYRSVDGPYQGGVICDHDAQERAQLRSAGISTVAAHKAVGPGIQAVQDRMAAGRLKFFAGGPIRTDSELKDAGKPTSDVEEFDSYVWEPAKEGRAEKEAPVKVNDHGCDSTRYIVCHVDNIGRAKVTWSV